MIKGWYEARKQEWEDMKPGFRYTIIGIVATGCIVIPWNAYRNHMREVEHQEAQSSSISPYQRAPISGQANATTPAPTGNDFDLLPQGHRNQGLETLSAKMKAYDTAQAQTNQDLEKVEAELHSLLVKTSNGSADVHVPSAGISSSQNPSGNSLLSKDLPPDVSFDKPGSGNAYSQPGSKQPANDSQGESQASAIQADDSAVPERPKMIHQDVVMTADDQQDPPPPDLVIPVNAALKAVMLSGVNALPSGSAGGAAGSVKAAVDVGAPFITRIKGAAIMPNSWKASDLENCFVSGSATANLSMERALAITNEISCIRKNGDVYEGTIQAYALDIDGNEGLAGHVVNKQGEALMQAALTGLASGLGSALSPTSLPSYNSNATSGSTEGIQYPNPALIAQSSLGQGVNKAAEELSQFYLEFARQTFPVIEVTAGTRVTWILKKDVVLKRTYIHKHKDDNA